MLRHPCIFQQQTVSGGCGDKMDEPSPKSNFAITSAVIRLEEHSNHYVHFTTSTDEGNINWNILLVNGKTVNVLLAN